MDEQKGAAKFNRAGTLFKQGQFGEALELLDGLDADFPNTKGILYPKARCLEKLGRLDDAEAICEALVNQFQDPRGETLKAKIQASRDAGAGIGMGMDLSGLDDLFGPAPKRTPPPAATPSFDVKRYAVIGLIIVGVLGVAALGYVAYQKGWFPSRGETLEQIEAKIMDVWGKADAYTASLDVSGQMKQQNMTFNIKGGGEIQCMKKDGKPLYRLDGVISATGAPMPVDVVLLAVADGTTAYMQMDMMGQKMVMKFPMPPSSQITPDLGKMLFENLHKELDVKLLRDEVLDGVAAYAFELTPKPGSDTAAAIPQAGGDFEKLKVHFTKDFTSQVRLTAFNKTGAPQFTLSVKNIDFKPSLSADRFTYKPPDGVKVMDMSDPSGFMKMMGGPGGAKP